MLTETKDKIKQAFSVICPELILTDEELEVYINLVSPMLSESVFGNMYITAFVYLMAHHVVLRQLIAQSGENGSSDVGITGSVTSEKEGDLQRSYGDRSASFDMLDKTYYGIEFKRLRSMCVVPIVTRLDNAL